MERTLSPDSCSFMNYSDDNSLPYPPTITSPSPPYPDQISPDKVTFYIWLSPFLAFLNIYFVFYC